MATEHADIVDAERHEAKGASTALAGRVLQANGDGTTSFVVPSTLSNINISSSIEAQSLATQNPSAVDTPLQIVFGSGTSNSDVNVASNGIVTILTAGLYHVSYSLNFGRSNATGIATLFSRMLINDVPAGVVQSAKIDTSINVSPVSEALIRSFAANDTIKVQIIRDSGGTNDGGLISLDPVLVAWTNSPSAYIRVQKIGGGA